MYLFSKLLQSRSDVADTSLVPRGQLRHARSGGYLFTYFSERALR